MATDAAKVVDQLAVHLMLGSLLAEVRNRWNAYELLDHWKQGEFHHDVVLRVRSAVADLGGDVLVVATNCNGGVKEVLCFEQIPDRAALWHFRCPDNLEFAGEAPSMLASSRTEHWFNPCELLRSDARSEFREEYRERQCGGGWIPRRSID